VEWRGEQFEFDRKKTTFILATTNPEKMVAPLVNRMTSVGFKSYTHEEIRDILKLSAKGKIKIDKNIVLDIAMSCRKSPRIASIQMLPNLERIALMGGGEVTKEGWDSFKESMGILPLGLEETEAEFLLYLFKQIGGSETNQSIAAHLKLDRLTVSKSVQTYLMEADLIYIGDGSKRIITDEGRRVAKMLLDR
jgi:Holliday junction resolvasome RuvABC ATP-dependent DNA helicase subunit